MDSRKLLFTLFSLFILSLSLLSGQGSAGRHHHHHHHRHHHYFRPSKLFVFGDSYVDTGNINKSSPNFPKYPYGITFPGKPFGRFSDGRVLTDFLSRFLGLKSPIPYRMLEKIGFIGLEDGVNFAFGGTGVFDTSFQLPNMTTQIDYFHNLIADSTFTGKDINSSFALVSVSGNDYSYYLAINGSIEGFKPLIISVVKQITVNLKRIHSYGVKKILMTALGPLGCVPQITAPSSFGQCNDTINTLVDFHNYLLKQAVEKLNSETKDSPFFILDIHGAFLSIINNEGNETFKTVLKPCCFGTSRKFSCGSVDEHGNNKYVLCEDPKSSFFWDAVHPTQHGWNAAFTSLIPILKQVYN